MVNTAFMHAFTNEPCHACYTHYSSALPAKAAPVTADATARSSTVDLASLERDGVEVMLFRVPESVRSQRAVCFNICLSPTPNDDKKTFTYSRRPRDEDD